MQTAACPTPLPIEESGRSAPPAGPAGRCWSVVDLATAAILGGVALAVRLPHLWTVPRFTDETLEVLHSLAIVREGARPLTNYDSYYGALYNYLVAAALWLSGESPFAPRLVVALAGALTVAATYLLGRDVARSAGVGQNPARVAGALAALMLATNGAHVVVNSHIAWSNCLTPLLTTTAFWLLLRRIGRQESLRVPLSSRAQWGSRGPTVLRCEGSTHARGRVDPSQARDDKGGDDKVAWALPLAGLLFGLALQTHPLVVALLPGAALAIVWRAPVLLRTPWPYAALALFFAGYANVLVYNWQTGWETVASAQRIRAEYALDQQASSGYLATLGAMLLLLARILGGAVDQRSGALEYLADPFVVLALALTVVAAIWLARRGQPLPLLVCLGFLLLLPAVNPKFRTLLTARYLMPVVPLLLAASAAFLVHASAALVAGRLGRSTLQGQKGMFALCAPLAAVLLVLWPLAPLTRYYTRTFERSDTNERIMRLTDEIVAAGAATGERVLVDDSMGTELPDTGVTELRGFEHLLVFARVPYRVVRVSPGRLQDELRGDPSVLAVLNARDAAAAAERLGVTPLDPRPPATAGRGSDYRLYRLESKREVPGARASGPSPVGGPIRPPWNRIPTIHTIRRDRGRARGLC